MRSTGSTLNPLRRVSRWLEACRFLAAAFPALAPVPLLACRAERPPPEAASPALAAGRDAPVAAAEDGDAAVPVEPAEPAPSESAAGPEAADSGEDAVGEAPGDVPAAEPPLLPTEPFDLPVDGFEPAVAVPPDPSFRGVAPLIVILHGNFDRPEWECATWRPVGAQHGWLLCPRGSPRTDVEPALDRWTWTDAAAARRETAAAVRALQAAWPGRVREDGAVLIGFSLGARHAPKVAAGEAGVRFESLVLVEQGFAATAADARAAREAGVARVVYVCGERTECPKRAEAARGRWERAGVAVDRLVMEGVGHAYPADFDALAERVFEALAAER